MIRKILGLVFICMSLFSEAQEMATPEVPQMADAFRADGKIYVVLTVIAIVFLSLVCFLVYIERKVKKLEDQIKNKG